MTSMTGYAYKEISTETSRIAVEIKSVNSRFLDLNINLPPYLSQLEIRFREKITERILRGKVDVNIRIYNFSGNEKITADTKAAMSCMSAIKEIAAALGKNEDDIPLSFIVNQPGVLNVEQEYDADGYWKTILPVFSEVFETFNADRVREGINLCRDLTEKLAVLDDAATFFKAWQPKMEVLFRDIITRKFHELLGEAVDEQRIMAETASMLVKYTINEEIVRLHSHLSALRSEIEHNVAPGKKIDFLCQEINREINTIGSKNQFAEVGSMVVTAKDALENIREQARNVE